MNEPETILLENFCSDLGLEIVFAGRGRVTLSSYSVTRPGLQFAGFFKYFDSSRILVLGNSEYEFLRDLPQDVRRERIKTLLSYSDIPCIILARDLPVLQELVEEARLTGCPILRTDKMTTVILNDLFFYLNKHLAPIMTMHGVLVDVSGVGILLTGHSGVGKSETADGTDQTRASSCCGRQRCYKACIGRVVRFFARDHPLFYGAARHRDHQHQEYVRLRFHFG